MLWHYPNHTASDNRRAQTAVIMQLLVFLQAIGACIRGDISPERSPNDNNGELFQYILYQPSSWRQKRQRGTETQALIVQRWKVILKDLDSKCEDSEKKIAILFAQFMLSF